MGKLFTLDDFDIRSLTGFAEAGLRAESRHGVYLSPDEVLDAFVIHRVRKLGIERFAEMAFEAWPVNWAARGIDSEETLKSRLIEEYGKWLGREVIQPLRLM